MQFLNCTNRDNAPKVRFTVWEELEIEVGLV
jgi:hypothetical protein